MKTAQELAGIIILELSEKKDPNLNTVLAAAHEIGRLSPHVRTEQEQRYSLEVRSV